MRFLVAGALLAYGVAHIHATVGAWRTRASTGGGVQVNRVAIDALWLVTAVALVISAAGAAAAATWWPTMTLCSAGASLALSAARRQRFGAGIPIGIVTILTIAAAMSAGRGARTGEAVAGAPAGCWSRPAQPSR